MIWGFGDSFTWGFGCRVGGPLPEYYTNYKKDGDKIWMEWLGEWFNEDIMNISQNGASNDKIFDWVIENFDNFKENDKVIIGMSIWGRMDIPMNNEWISIMSAWEYGGLLGLERQVRRNLIDEKFLETIVNYQYFFSQDKLWEDKWRSRFNFIVNQLKKKKCQTLLFQIQEPIVLKQHNIKQDSGIMDGHFSFTGHKKFAEILHKRLSSNLI
jgi:hypothetical protein